MPEATKKYGNPRRIPFTPGAGNIAAGEVVMLGNLAGVSCGIATQDIANGVEGSLEIGGGVYEVTMLTNMANYALVYWDTAINKVVATSTNMMVFGVIVEGGNTGANALVYVYHDPMAPRV